MQAFVQAAGEPLCRHRGTAETSGMSHPTGWTYPGGGGVRKADAPRSRKSGEPIPRAVFRPRVRVAAKRLERFVPCDR